MIIRPSKNDDLESIASLYEDAFGEHDGKVIAQLALDIIEDETAVPFLSIVAENHNSIVGHITFSPVVIEGEKELSTYILAPLAVSKAHQKKGIGTKLINYGLDEMRKHSVDIILVLGDPHYYTRVGFNGEHNIKPPYKLEYPEAWMALELNPEVLKKVKGVAQCCSSLSSPEHW